MSGPLCGRRRMIAHMLRFSETRSGRADVAVFFNSVVAEVKKRFKWASRRAWMEASSKPGVPSQLAFFPTTLRDWEL